MKRAFTVMALSLVTLILVFSLANPVNAPAFLLIVPFIAIFMFLFALVYLICKRKGWGRGRSFRAALVSSGVPVVILVLQSIGQLTIRDLLTIGAIFLVLYFYLSRLSFAKQ